MPREQESIIDAATAAARAYKTTVDAAKAAAAKLHGQTSPPAEAHSEPGGVQGPGGSA